MKPFAKIQGAIRIIVGLFYIYAGLPKLTGHAHWVASFRHWNVPLPGLAVYAVGTFEVVAGGMLAAGVATRVLASLFIVDMAGAFAFAGLKDGGSNIVLPVLLGGLNLLIAIRGGGAWQAMADPFRTRPAARIPGG